MSSGKRLENKFTEEAVMKGGKWRALNALGGVALELGDLR